MLLYFVRHGDPIYNPDSLTPLGHRQAEAVAKRLAVHGIDRIFSSTSTRAIQTAEPTSEICKKEITLLDWCNEGHAWNEFAIPIDEKRNTWIFQHPTVAPLLNQRSVFALGEDWHTHPDLAPYHLGDGMARVSREADAFLASLGYTHDRERMVYVCTAPQSERVALFAHQGFGMMFLSAVLDIPYPVLIQRFDLSHSSVTVLYFAESGESCVPKVLTLSNDSHIYRDGLPTRFCNDLLI